MLTVISFPGYLFQLIGDSFQSMVLDGVRVIVGAVEAVGEEDESVGREGLAHKVCSGFPLVNNQS